MFIQIYRCTILKVPSNWKVPIPLGIHDNLIWLRASRKRKLYFILSWQMFSRGTVCIWNLSCTVSMWNIPVPTDEAPLWLWWEFISIVVQMCYTMPLTIDTQKLSKKSILLKDHPAQYLYFWNTYLLGWILSSNYWPILMHPSESLIGVAHELLSLIEDGWVAVLD